MSDNNTLVIAANTATRLILLRTLWFLNVGEYYPTATTLARSIDPRDDIPRGTLHTRRVMIRIMLDAGLIRAHEGYQGSRVQLEITHAGIELIQRIDIAGRTR